MKNVVAPWDPPSRPPTATSKPVRRAINRTTRHWNPTAFPPPSTDSTKGPRRAGGTGRAAYDVNPYLFVPDGIFPLRCSAASSRGERKARAKRERASPGIRDGPSAEGWTVTKKWRAAVVGYGNIGRFAVEALQEAPDFELAGIVRRDPRQREGIDPGIPVVARTADLDGVDVALLCVPTRSVPEQAERHLAEGIHTVDSYDIHGELVDVKNRLDAIARANGRCAIISAGWDPGTDSIIRALLEAMAPRGITYTNFGPGMSMGHTVAVRAIDGVRDAL